MSVVLCKFRFETPFVNFKHETNWKCCFEVVEVDSFRKQYARFKKCVL